MTGKVKFSIITSFLLIAIITLSLVTITPTAVFGQEIPSNSVEYTEQEKQTLEAMKKKYQESVELWNSAGKGYFIVEPDISKNPIEAGKMKEEIAKATTMFLNVVRIGASLPEIAFSEEITEAAQYKAALVVHNSTAKLKSGHNPEKPNTVSDEFYKKAMSYMNENLYMAGFSGDPISSIIYAISDSYGDSITCGHRYNLLNPSATKFGIGLVSGQSVHKLEVGTNDSIEVVAWPSKGVMLKESYMDGYWTTLFYKNYSVTPSTAVKVTLLNTGESWSFSSSTTNTDDNLFHINGNLVTFYNKQMDDSKKVGNVYEITLSNLQGNSSTYTYRSVYESVEDLYQEETKDNTTSNNTNNNSDTDNNSGTGNNSTNNNNTQITQPNVDDTTKKLDLKDNPSSWAEPIIREAISLNLVPEKLQERYTESISRSEFCALAVQLYEKVKGISISSRRIFDDTTDVNVQKIASLGIVTGTGNNLFSPNQNLTREQAAVILARLSAAIDKPLNNTPVNFEDKGQISSWALEAVGQVQDAKIMNGTGDNKFSPKSQYSIEQSIATIMNLYHNKGNNQQSSSEIWATPSQTKVVVNGTTFETYAYFIDGENYFRDVDLASMIGSYYFGYEKTKFQEAEKVIDWEVDVFSDFFIQENFNVHTPSKPSGKEKAIKTDVELLIGSISITAQCFKIGDDYYFNTAGLFKTLNGQGMFSSYDSQTDTLTIHFTFKEE